ncbi:MAG: tetratricopeptide repeat protein [Anaerolineae bacterium]|nr:tetratricopeptide repeat protein [Anaerolineae bacterium]
MDLKNLALGLYPYLEWWGYWSTAVLALNMLLANSHVRHSTPIHIDVLLKLSYCYFLQKQLILAESFAQAAEVLIRSGIDAAQTSRLYELRANILMAKGEYRKAVNACTRAIEAAAEAHTEDLEQQARHTMALAFSSMGEYDRLGVVLQQASSPTLIAKSVARAKLFQCQAQALAAVTLFLQGKLPDAEQKARQALEIARNTHNHRWIILSLEWLGWICNTQGKYDEVSCMMSEALALVQEAEFKEDLTFLYCNLGLIAKAKGALEEGQGHLLSALAIANEVPTGRMNGKSTLYSTLARIQVADDDLSGAEMSANQSIDVADNKMEIIPSLALLGYIKARQGETSHSAAHFGEAASRARRLGMLNGMFSLFATHYRGEAALHLGNYEAAVTDFAAAYKLAERTQSPESLGISSLGLARAYLAVQQRDNARAYAEISRTHLEGIGHCYSAAANAVLENLSRSEQMTFNRAYGF